jgi:hypothetical protein
LPKRSLKLWCRLYHHRGMMDAANLNMTTATVRTETMCLNTHPLLFLYDSSAERGIVGIYS